MKTYEKNQLDQLSKIEAAKFRDGNGNYTNWLNVNDVAMENAIKEVMTTDRFSFYYNMLEQHNGYTNVFTYLLACEIDSNENLLKEFQSIAKDEGIYQCEMFMKEYFQNEIPRITERSLETILNCGLDCVNFTELAHKMLEE